MHRVSYGIAMMLIFVATGSAWGQDANAKIRLKYGLTVNPSDVSYAYSQKFAELVQKYSNGRVEVVLYPSNQLGDDQETRRRDFGL
jgi:TRAP-type C4-dicarboxylate transport system substrate-binding protein